MWPGRAARTSLAVTCLRWPESLTCRVAVTPKPASVADASVSMRKLASTNAIGIFRHAPHPNAARLYIDYWLSDEAQMMWAKTGMGVVRSGLDDRIPADVREFAQAKLMGTTDPDRQDEGLALAKRIYK